MRRAAMSSAPDIRGLAEAARDALLVIREIGGGRTALDQRLAAYDAAYEARSALCSALTPSRVLALLDEAANAMKVVRAERRIRAASRALLVPGDPERLAAELEAANDELDAALSAFPAEKFAQ